jgi:hypothetical protein
MIKNEQKVIDNFYGIDFDYKLSIYNNMLLALDKDKDYDLIRALTNMLEYDLKRLKELYDLNNKGLSLKSYYTAKLLKNNREYIDDYLNSSSYYKNEDYKESFFYNSDGYTMHLLDLTNQIFETKKLDEKYVVEFINSFNQARYEEKKRFINLFVRSNYYCAFIPTNYIPGVNMMNNDFDDLILHLFGDKVFEQYSKLEPIRKTDFIFKFRREISTYFNNQSKNKFNKNKNLIKKQFGNR